MASRFEELRKFADQRWPMPVETSLLGRVPYYEEDGKFVSAIPDWITKEAQEHGLIPVSADFRRGTYMFKLAALPPLKGSPE